MVTEKEIEKLQVAIIKCRKCPRLVAYLREVSRHKPRRFRDWDYWGRPLPSFGDPEARLLVIGLAPAAHGGNRTGRMFTGDRSGEWLFRALYEFGFANRPDSTTRDDEFALTDCYITATIRCAPPANKPAPEEIENCRPYLLRELELLKGVKVLLPLGQIAFSQTLRSLRLKGYDVPPLSFRHGKVYEIPGVKRLRSLHSAPRTISLVASYHPSQQNTQTGKLTKPMFDKIFKEAKRLSEVGA